MDAAVVFRSAVTDLEAGLDQQRQVRPQLAFEKQPPPRRLAPFAAAIGATVHDPDLSGETAPGAGEDADTEIAWGSFVLLYDPAGQTGWAGPFRVIAYIRADLEPEIAADPLVGQVGWSWLTEALDTRGAGYAAPSGTVTRVVTEGFGTKQDEPMATEFEMRASWSPATAEDRGAELDRHFAAWADTLCHAAGLPPLPPGVAQIRTAQLRQPRARRRP